MKKLDILAAVLVVVGGLNWGLVAIANFDLVATLVGLDFGETNAASRVVYGLVGLAAVYQVVEQGGDPPPLEPRPARRDRMNPTPSGRKGGGTRRSMHRLVREGLLFKGPSRLHERVGSRPSRRPIELMRAATRSGTSCPSLGWTRPPRSRRGPR